MKKLKWTKNKEGYIAFINSDRYFYFIPDNATYWCSSDPNGNGQIGDRDFDFRLREAKREANFHYQNL